MESETATKAPKKSSAGGRPRSRDYASMLNTEEGRAAVKQASEAIMGDLVKQLQAARGDAGVAAVVETASGSDRELLSNLAQEIARVSDQGTQRKRLSPAEIAKREEAHARMIDMLIRYHATGTVCTYVLVSKVYLNERVVDPFMTDPNTKRVIPQEADWSGVPNEAMRPVNEAAKAVFTEMLASIGGQTALTPNADKRVISVTPNGLVVRGQVGHKRQVGGIDATIPAGSTAPAPFSDSLSIKGPFDPRATEINVLGTIAAPARQNYQSP